MDQATPSLADLLAALSDALYKHKSIRFTCSITLGNTRKPATENKPTTGSSIVPFNGSANKVTGEEASESLVLLERAGIDGDDIIRLASNHTPSRITHVLKRIDESDKPVKSRAGYLRRALEQGWYR